MIEVREERTTYYVTTREMRLRNSRRMGARRAIVAGKLLLKSRNRSWLCREKD